MTVNERIIQNWLWRYHRNSSELVMPSYTPKGWWECDLMVVTKSLMWHEYEIKLSRKDFYKDQNKGRRRLKKFIDDHGVMQFGPVTETTKHLLIAGASRSGPNCFWFVMPRDLVPLDEVPSWAGVKILVPRGRWLAFDVVRKAPRIHTQPVSQEIVDHARSVCYWRYWHERGKK